VRTWERRAQRGGPREEDPERRNPEPREKKVTGILIVATGREIILDASHPGSGVEASPHLLGPAPYTTRCRNRFDLLTVPCFTTRR